MTFRMRKTMTGVALLAALVPGLGAAQPRPLAVRDLVGASIEAADGQFKGALKVAWVERDGTMIHVAAPGRCRLSHDGQAMPVALLSRDGKVKAVLRRTGPSIAFKREGPDRLLPSDDPLAPAPGALPAEDGLAATTARLETLALPAEATLQVQCNDRAPVYAPAKPAEGLQAVAELPAKAAVAVWFAPVWLFGVPSENRSREVGATQGPLALNEVSLGQPLVGGAEGFRNRHRKVVRMHAGGDDYAVLSIDLGGPPGRGVSLPREVVFVGVRGGVVEWVGHNSGGVGQSLCTGADGRFGGRKGCTTTGYYSPRV